MTPSQVALGHVDDDLEGIEVEDLTMVLFWVYTLGGRDGETVSPAVDGSGCPRPAGPDALLDAHRNSS